MQQSQASFDLVQSMVRYYSERASIYDHSMGYDRTEVVTRHARVIQALQQQLQGRDILEIASGPGFLTSQVAPHCRSVLATDISPSTQEEARKRLAIFNLVIWPIRIAGRFRAQ